MKHTETLAPPRSSQQKTKTGHGGGALVALSAAIVAVAYGMARFALGLSTPRIIDDGVATESQIGYASSLSYITYVIACFASTAWLNRNKWRLCITSVALTAATGCALIAVSHYPLWCFC